MAAISFTGMRTYELQDRSRLIWLSHSMHCQLQGFADAEINGPYTRDLATPTNNLYTWWTGSRWIPTHWP